MRLNEQQREVINLLAGGMMSANKAIPYDVKGYESNSIALYAFLKSICGTALFHKIEHTRDNWNWFGNRTFADDAQAAIDYAIEDSEKWEYLS